MLRAYLEFAITDASCITVVAKILFEGSEVNFKQLEVNNNSNKPDNG